jgi:hypothetical protein
MRSATLAVGASNVYGSELAVWMGEMLIEGMGIIQISFVGCFTNSLVHGELRKKVLCCLLVVHSMKSFRKSIKKISAKCCARF